MTFPGKMAAEALRHVAQRPATVAYPAEPAEMPEAYRGKVVFRAELCVGCKLCQKDCPAGALTITKVGDKRFQATFDLDRCIYCAQCVDSCNKDALVSTTEFELASLSRATLHLVFDAPSPPVAAAPSVPPAAPPSAPPAPAAPTGGADPA